MGHSVSKEIVKQLSASGVRKIFGIPGSNGSIELIEEGKKLGVDFVPVGHEAAAAIMAGTYGTLTESAGVCLAIMGPGALNLNSGLLHCAFERSPVVGITERYSAKVRETVKLQNIDHGALFGPVVKQSSTFSRENCAELISDSIQMAMAERPGPVHIDLPHDVAVEELESSSETQRPTVATGRVSADVLRDSAERLSAATRPVIVLGSLALREGLGDLVTKFSEKFSAPILVSMKARGVVDETSSWYAGPYLGVGKAELIENRLLEEADLVVSIGIDGYEIVMPASRQIDAIAIDRVPSDIGNVYLDAAVLLGDPSATLEELTAVARSASIWKVEQVERVVDTWLKHVATFDAEDSVQAMIRIARETMATDDIFVCDIGLYSKLVEQLWVARRPGTFHTSLAARNMGSALPMAIGASLAKPDCSTVCFIGDGGLLINLAELNVIAQEKLPVVIVVFVDGGWATIRVFQRNKKYELEGTNFHQPDWLGIAAKFGFETAHANTEGEYRSEMSRMLGSKKPSILTVAYQQEEYDKILSMVR